MDRRSVFRVMPVVGVLLTKAAKILSLLKVAKFTNLVVTATTMLVSIVSYSFLLGPWLAVGLVLMLLVHELGHVIALRQKGLVTSWPVFIPFLGALIFAPAMSDRRVESYVAFGGPLVGSIAALMCTAAWLMTESPLLLMISFFGVYINLFNLIPLSPFDGGRVLQVVGPWIKYFGILLLIGYTAVVGQPALLLIWIFVLQEISLPLWWRPTLASVLTLTMASLAGAGFSDQSPVIDGVDVILGCAFVMLYYWFDSRRSTRPILPDHDTRPYPGFVAALPWLSLYVGLASVLSATLVYLIDQMPH